MKRTRLAYGLLLGVWGIIAAWQIAEHHRVKTSARAALINRSKDIAEIISGVIGSASFRGIVIQDRLESALNRLVKPGELISVALLNASNEVVAAVGSPVDAETTSILTEREHWGQKTVTFVSPVYLGGGSMMENGTNYPPIIVQPPPRRDLTNSVREGGRGMERPEAPPGEGRPPEARPSDGTSSSSGYGEITNRDERRIRDREARRRSGRPPWMTEAEYQSARENRSLHGLVMVMSIESLQALGVQDFWLRCIIGTFATISVVGLGLAWRNQAKSAELQMRLLRASELNTHLKEMNLAAAGLAHETRNPLNIIRGLAQMISKQKEAPTEVRSRSREIIDETDRVTAQLNEFINYSRPREVRRAPVSLSLVVGEVVRALGYDLEEKCIRLLVPESLPVIEADEQLLRQALFNLLINAVQAVERGGDIEVAAWKDNSRGVILEIRDNGPGVSSEHRSEIFKPYFTTHQQGTGLGLAVVQQIILAHGWEIECAPNEPRGAIFRITHLKLASAG
jgi:signal transduction histidine kinase